MTRMLLLAVALVACTKSNEVDLLFGPSESSFSQGFQCRDSANVPLLGRTLQGGQLVFQVVIDVIDLQGKFPGCRGEELFAACQAPSCPVAVSASPTRRYCERISIPVSTDPTTLGRAIREELANRGKILSDAPDHPVVIRVVTTEQPCEEIAQIKPADPTQYVDLDPLRAVGCAYTCPVQLDEITGSISVSLDALNDRCEQIVRACAAFPQSPG